MLSPELNQLYNLLAELKEHDQPAGLVLEDVYGCRWAVQRAFVVGARTDDPGLVIRLTDREQTFLG